MNKVIDQRKIFNSPGFFFYSYYTPFPVPHGRDDWFSPSPLGEGREGGNRSREKN